MMNEREARRQMLRIGRLCYERHLLVAMDGNLSVKLEDGSILCTQAGCHKGFLEDEHLIRVDQTGKKLSGRGQPTSEMAMHIACYRARPDIEAVVHAHPPLAIAFTIAGVSLDRCVLPEVVLTLGTVPTVAYATTGTQHLADAIQPFIKTHDAILMDRHGAVCVGPSLIDAFCKLETLEHTALIIKTAQDLGRVRQLPSDEAAALRSMGLKRYGGPPEAVALADSPGADLPDACLCTPTLQAEQRGLSPEAHPSASPGKGALATMASVHPEVLARQIRASGGTGEASVAEIQRLVMEELQKVLAGQAAR